VAHAFLSLILELSRESQKLVDLLCVKVGYSEQIHDSTSSLFSTFF